MPGAHAREDRNLRVLRMITGAVAALGLLAAGVLPFATPAPAQEATQTAQAIQAADRPRTVQAPQDVARADEWWLTTIRGQKAAKVSRGSGITVAVLDTGVDGTQLDL